jgi:tetratricopeptide (TPR) repeat protein
MTSLQTKISKIDRIQGKQAAPVCSGNTGAKTSKKDSIIKHPSQDVKSRPQTLKTKKLSLVALIAGAFLVIGLDVVIAQEDFETSMYQISVKAPPAKEIKLSAKSTKIEDTETYQKGMDALINRRFNEAIAIFDELLVLGPEMKNSIALPYTEALVGLANNVKQTNTRQAIFLFKKAIQFDPNRDQAHFQLGMAFMKQKNYAAATESYENVIRLNPQLPDSFFNLGYLYAMSKKYTQAEKMYVRVIELRPEYLDEALFNLALVQSKLDKKNEALTNVLKAVQINPKNELAQNYLKKMKGVSAK